MEQEMRIKQDQNMGLKDYHSGVVMQSCLAWKMPSQKTVFKSQEEKCCP